MKIIFYTHPSFLGHKSMPRFTNMLAKGMAIRGHDVEVWYPSEIFAKLSKLGLLIKYLGYIDQLLIFPFQAKLKLKRKDEALHVLTDHALGPWMSFIKKRKHVVHCHDFIAQKAAVNKIEDLKIGILGRYYQNLIKKGYSKAHNFISVSDTTRKDLHLFKPEIPTNSQVVYNGLNQNFKPSESITSLRRQLEQKLNISLSNGFLFHIGNNEWYKNRTGVINLYDYWRNSNKHSKPLIMVGPKPTKDLIALKEASGFSRDILFLDNIADDLVKDLYSAATLLIFPSYTEGFGWPIAEAMASGCPVITTAEAPMTEVGGKAAFYIPKRPYKQSEQNEWLKVGAKEIEKVVSLSLEERKKVISSGIHNSKRFDSKQALDSIENIYKSCYSKNYENPSCSRSNGS